MEDYIPLTCQLTNWKPYTPQCVKMLLYITWSDQGLVKGVELCLNPYFFGWLEEVSWLAVEVLSPCQK